MSELMTTYISDTEFDTFMSDYWLEHPTPEEPHYEKLTDICHYSDISSDDMETELEDKRLLHNIKSNVTKYKEFLQSNKSSCGNTSHIDLFSLRLLKEQVQYGGGDGASQEDMKKDNETSDPENEEEDNTNVAQQGDGEAEPGGNNAQLDKDLRVNVDNFSNHFFTLELKKTRSFKHKKDDSQ